jgi:hypothetical protein
MADMGDQFPGFETCMRLMRGHDDPAQEDGFNLLLPRAHEHVEPLMEEFEREQDSGDAGLGFWLLELLAEARSPTALPLFVRCLRSESALLREGAILGLHRLGSQDARRALQEAWSYTFPTGDDTQFFRDALVRITGQTSGK